MRDSDTAKVIRDLLIIAKVAMPPKLYSGDPRIAVAQGLLKTLEEGQSPSRAPNVTSRLPAHRFVGMTLQRPVEQRADGISFTADLPWDLVEAMTKALEVPSMPLDPSDALNFIARDWLTGHGYAGLLPGAEAEEH